MNFGSGGDDAFPFQILFVDGGGNHYSTFQVPNFLSLHNHRLHLGQSITDRKIPRKCWDAIPLPRFPSAGCEKHT